MDRRQSPNVLVDTTHCCPLSSSFFVALIPRLQRFGRLKCMCPAAVHPRRKNALGTQHSNRGCALPSLSRSRLRSSLRHRLSSEARRCSAWFFPLDARWPVCLSQALRECGGGAGRPGNVAAMSGVGCRNAGCHHNEKRVNDTAVQENGVPRSGAEGDKLSLGSEARGQCTSIIGIGVWWVTCTSIYSFGRRGRHMPAACVAPNTSQEMPRSLAVQVNSWFFACDTLPVSRLRAETAVGGVRSMRTETRGWQIPLGQCS